MTSAAPEPSDSPGYPILDEPADGIPDVVTDERALSAAADALAAGTGPVALDAERASGYRYSSRAYLVQLRREGAGTVLVDPVSCPDLTPIQHAIDGAEWVVHAATQDLPCLRGVGLAPAALFDTELGSRLAGLPRVALAAVVEHYLGVSLAKEHSAADWSTRPLPEPWLRYAALDVEVLVQVRDRLREDLDRQGKLGWALQDFEALTHFTGPAPRADPWRRTSGMHRLRDRRAIARVRELWQARDRIAEQRDIAPGRVLPDALIIEIANQAPRTAADLQRIATAPHPSGRRRSRTGHHGIARYRRDWLDAVARVRAMPDSALPVAAIRTDAPPPARAWTDRDPVAAARLSQVRDSLAQASEERHVPVENLLTPSALRRVLWEPAGRLDRARVEQELAMLGARSWQIGLASPLIVQAVADHPDAGPAARDAM